MAEPQEQFKESSNQGELPQDDIKAQNGHKTGLCRRCDQPLPQSCITKKKNNCGRTTCKQQNQPISSVFNMQPASNLEIKQKEQCYQYEQDLLKQIDISFRELWIQKFGGVNLNQDKIILTLEQNATRYVQSMQLIIKFFNEPPIDVIYKIQENIMRGHIIFSAECSKKLQFYLDRIETCDKQHNHVLPNMLLYRVCSMFQVHEIETVRKSKLNIQFIRKYDQYIEQFALKHMSNDMKVQYQQYIKQYE